MAFINPPEPCGALFMMDWCTFLSFKISTSIHCHYIVWKSQDIFFLYNSDCICLKDESHKLSTLQGHLRAAVKNISLLNWQLSPMRSSRSRATVSKARRIMGYSSNTSLKWSTESEYRRQYVSALTLAVLLPRVSKQISVDVLQHEQIESHMGRTCILLFL